VFSANCFWHRRCYFVSVVSSRSRSLALAALALGGALSSAGCHRAQVLTSRAEGLTDGAGLAQIHATAAGENQHYTVEVALRGAPAGTYALLFSRSRSGAPGAPGKERLSSGALACALSYGRGCSGDEPVEPGARTIVAAARVGPGGAGVLRASFDVGAGGWFTVVRVEGGLAQPARYQIRIDSEAVSTDEAPYRFVFEEYEAPPPAPPPATPSGPA
jgi:hypothetical protein